MVHWLVFSILLFVRHGLVGISFLFLLCLILGLSQWNRLYAAQSGGDGLGVEIDQIQLNGIRLFSTPEIENVLEITAGDRLQRGVVVLLAGHGKQFVGVLQVLIEFCQGADGGFERLALAAEVLRAFGVAPDGGVFAEFYDFF